jgi:hypothetical protein
MQAVLLISATHLASLQPVNATYQRASIVHLSDTLRLYRHALSRPITPSNADALMSTAMLLSHHAWADTGWIRVSPKMTFSGGVDSPLEASTLEESLDLSRDPLFALAPGMREIFMVSWPLISTETSIFASHAGKPHSSVFDAARKISRDPQKFQNFLVAYWNRNSQTPQIVEVDSGSHVPDTRPPLAKEGTDEEGGEDKQAFESDAYWLASFRLSPIFAVAQYFLCTTRPLSKSDADVLNAVIPDASRYLFSFHPLANDAITSMIQRHDKSALLLLFLFYRTARTLLPSHMRWWCHARAEKMETLLEKMLWRSTLESSECLRGL